MRTVWSHINYTLFYTYGGTADEDRILRKRRLFVLLEYLLGDNQILALYTYHNDEDYFTEYSITEKAKKLGIPVIYDAITPERIVKYFKEEGCGLLFVAEYNRIIPIPENLPEFRGMNVHSSLLPQGRSYYPIESAFRLGLKSSGATVHKLAPKLDKGGYNLSAANRDNSRD